MSGIDAIPDIGRGERRPHARSGRTKASFAAAATGSRVPLVFDRAGRHACVRLDGGLRHRDTAQEQALSGAANSRVRRSRRRAGRSSVPRSTPRFAGDGAFIMVAGEPGIGKTSLANEVRTRRRGRGALEALRGGSFEGGGTPPYWPRVQVLRACLTAPPNVRRSMERSAIRQPRWSCVSSYGSRRERCVRAGSRALSSFRFRRQRPPDTCGDSAARDCPRRSAMGGRSPRCCSSSSWDGISSAPNGPRGHLSRRRGAAPSRDRPAHRRHRCRRPHAALGGLAQSEVAALVARTSAGRFRNRSPPRVHAATGGNPLFVDELARSLVAEDRLEQSLSRRAIAAAGTGTRRAPSPDRDLSDACRRVLAVGR